MEGEMAVFRAVFHVSDGSQARGEAALRNIGNLIADLGASNVETELVANGEGVMLLLVQPNRNGERVAELATQGVRFCACAVALRQLGLTSTDLLAQVEVVRTGVGELVRRQAEGWAYIRP
jgi:uncharacterized protein